MTKHARTNVCSSIDDQWCCLIACSRNNSVACITQNALPHEALNNTKYTRCVYQVTNHAATEVGTSQPAPSCCGVTLQEIV